MNDPHAPITSHEDPRFNREPYNYRFIVAHDSRDFAATSFEMPMLTSYAATSHGALAQLARHLDTSLHDQLEPSSRNRLPSEAERRRFLPLTERLLHQSLLGLFPATPSEPHQPDPAWVRLTGHQPTGNPAEYRDDLSNLDRADVSLWAHPHTGYNQLVQIHNQVYAAADTAPAEKRWPPDAIQFAAGFRARDENQHYPDEDTHFTTVIAGTAGLAVCEGDSDTAPNLMRVRRFDPTPGTDRLTFWNALKDYVRAHTVPEAKCQDCPNPAAYIYRPAGARGYGPQMHLRLCFDCTTAAMITDMPRARPQPTVVRI